VRTPSPRSSRPPSPPARTTSAGPDMRSPRARSHRSSGRGSVVSPGSSRRSRRRSGRSSSRLGILEAALRAVDMAHRGAAEDRPRSSGRREALGGAAPRSARRMSIRRGARAGAARCRPPRARARGSPRELVVGERRRIGRRVLVVVGQVARALEDRALERRGRVSSSVPRDTWPRRRATARSRSASMCRGAPRRAETASS
jgi:hypothetical protein